MGDFTTNFNGNNVGNVAVSDVGGDAAVANAVGVNQQVGTSVSLMFDSFAIYYYFMQSVCFLENYPHNEFRSWS